METRAMGIRIWPIRIKAMTRATGTRLTWIRDRLLCALMATTLIILTPAHPMGTTDLAGSRAASSSASGRGVGAGATSTVAVGTTVDVVTAGVGSTADAVTAGAATTGADSRLPRAGDLTVTADVPSLAPAAASVAVP